MSSFLFDVKTPGKYTIKAKIVTTLESASESGKLQQFKVEGHTWWIPIWKDKAEKCGASFDVGTEAEMVIEVKKRTDASSMDIKCISWGGLKSGASGGGGGRGGWGGGVVKSDREIVANLIGQSQLAAATACAAFEGDSTAVMKEWVEFAMATLEKHGK